MVAERDIHALMETQHGLVTRQQVLGAGMTGHQIEVRLRSACWVRAARGVYRHAVVPSTVESRLLAPCLAYGALASHRSAAALHGIDGYELDRVEVVVAKGRVRRIPGARLHHSTQMHLAPPVERHGIPCTRVGRTVLDLAGSVSRAALDRTIDAVLRNGLLRLSDLWQVLVSHSKPGRNGCVALRDALLARAGEGSVPLSDWSRMVADLLESSGLPHPVFEHRVENRDGHPSEEGPRPSSPTVCVQFSVLEPGFCTQSRDALEMADVLIHGGAVVTEDDSGAVHDPGWVYVRGNRVAEVAAGEPPPSRLRQAEEVIDAVGCAVMPGMTNAHTHLFQAFFRGLADDRTLLDWLRDCIWPVAVHLDEEIAAAAALAGLVENLRGGATAVIDHQYVHTDEGINDAVCRAADELGVRFLLAHGWADRNYHPELEQTAEQAVARADAARRSWDGRNDDRIRVELAPLIPWGCSDEGMRTTVAATRSWGRGTHIHCAETEVEVEMSLEERGVRHVTWLDSLGALGPDMQLAHSVWVDDDELNLIAASGAVVVHCPVSNMYLASGVAPVTEMQTRGITVALASDGPGSNNRQDMFEVLKATVLLQKVHYLDALVLQPEDVLRMACRGGAAAFGMAGAFGTVAEGQRADLLVVDLRSPFVAPVHRVTSALVYNATPRDVRDVMVDGRILIRHGQLVVADERQIMAEADAAARRLFHRAGIASRVTRS